MALASLICALVLITPQTQTPSNMFKQIVPKPTGKNGYEEYLIAADYFVNSGLQKRVVALGSQPTLSQRVTALDGFRRVVDLLETGNTKGAWDPRVEMDFNTLFPDYTQFKSMIKAVPHYAYVQLARGNGAEAVRAYEAALKMSRGIQPGILIAHLVGIALDQIVVFDIVKMRVRLSERDAERCAQLLEGFVASPTLVGDSLIQEHRMLRNSLTSVIEAAKVKGVAKVIAELMDEELPANDKGAAELSKLTPQEFAERIEKGLARREAILGTMIKGLSGEERTWHAPQVETGELLLDIVAPVYDQVITASARHRTNMRLVALALRCETYRWETGSYPIKLSDAVPATKLYDPLTGKDFNYRLEGGVPDIWSEGGVGTGRLDLTFKRSASSSGEERSDP